MCGRRGNNKIPMVKSKLKPSPRIAAAVARGQKKGMAQAQNRSKAVKPKAGIQLDAYALAHARLLNDPCYGRLAHPVYNSADGGCLSRFEAEFTAFSGATETGGIVAFVPGGLARSVFNNAVVCTSDIVATTLVNASTSNTAPGYSFLQSTASAVRPVAACMQIAWPGTELNRQGFVALGQATGSLITEALTTNITISGVRPVAHLRSRVPETVVEVKWRPQSGDADWTDPNTSTADGDLQKKGAIFAAISNLPVGTGVRVRLICVYEWQPKAAQGMASNADDRARSRNTLTDVINVLDKDGPDWAFTVGRTASAVQTLYDAYKTGRTAMVMG